MSCIKYHSTSSPVRMITWLSTQCSYQTTTGPALASQNLWAGEVNISWMDLLHVIRKMVTIIKHLRVILLWMGKYWLVLYHFIPPRRPILMRNILLWMKNVIYSQILYITQLVYTYKHVWCLYLYSSISIYLYSSINIIA